MEALIHAIVLTAAYSEYVIATEAACTGNSKRNLAKMESAYAVFKAAKLAAMGSK